MSKSMNSPTARLLQSSRLFSLPRPLPQPALETATSTGVYRASDSATLPYPTYQAIASPASSRFRGDWGLKRALPAKSTRSSTPHIRVKAHDNFAHITDFESAADHTQTEAKWRQMGIPLVVRERKGYSNEATTTGSAYDDHIDNTDPEAVFSAQQNARPDNPGSVQWKRWKSDSPWLAGMQPGEFEIYVEKRLKSRQGEFQKFMIERLAQQRVRDEERRHRDLGQRRALSRSQRSTILQDVVTNYEAEMKRLRDDHTVQSLASELTSAICDFLGLTGVQDSTENQVNAKTERLKNTLANISSESNAPPSTHPAAGLSHIRTNAIMENHPFWGPQAQGSPVLARVVRPRHTAHGSEPRAKLGVGGVVANDDSTQTSAAWQDNRLKALDFENTPIEQFYENTQRMTEHIEVDLPGGNKVWVHPESATVDDQGRIQLKVRRGDSEAIAIARDDVEAIHEAKRAALRQAPSMPPARGTAANANYGYSLPDTRYGPPKSRVQGFDDMLSRSPRSSRSADASALDKIKDLAGGFGRK
ncbi:hypothetical protein M409DRAFT_50271 [Zasmidium cellare ATCC 36951]|uniref:Uncharacterized protein n=1 Tax=Zasmidium cellare ATCC 36951 TaxID=1080233 RepID=A0A6A6D1S0_ZASCE|nr:uncharacterized protein M409DRAFT_50271 [Zasmidium cellare ATCC 36951]KAF2171596.1 hypothetical protein M409DRAFT_50271 [Zasmidium cellare ATCC 36951]